MRIQYCGVRGSTPAPGGEFVRVGGSTSCVAVLAGDDREPSLVLDAGTGLRAVTGLLDRAAFRGTILLTHLHWDHWQGLPFFAAGDRDDAQVRVIGPAQDEPLVDVLVHDAQFLDHERGVADEYGHSTVLDAVQFAQEAEVGELVLFHHAPNRSAAALDELVRPLEGSGVRITVAIEGVERHI